MDLNTIKRFDNHAHSYFSNIRLIDAICKPRDMILTAHKLGMAGMTLTDHECLCGHIELLKEEKDLKEKGLIPKEFKCGLGNEIYLVDDRHNIERYWHYILIAKNNTGHRALRELSSIAWYNGFNSRGMMRVPTEKNELVEIVKKYPNSLIASTACIGGEVAHFVLELVKAEDRNDEKEIFKWKKEIDSFMRFNIDLFDDDFYIEIAAATSEIQEVFNKRIKSIAKAYNRKIIIGSDAHYLTADDREVHKAYLNSKEGEREVDSFYYFSHMMDNEEAFNNLKNIYSEDEFIKICNNSMEIYNKIEGYNLEHKPIIPKVDVIEYPIKNKWSYNGIDIKAYPVLYSLLSKGNKQERYWINQCLEELINKELVKENYLQRLEIEADIIQTIGNKLENCLFEYFNTFQHYIDLFWECGSLSGPGRGSSVCFLSNYLLGITQLDPIKWKLKEWRFLNKERLELPDIDTDLCPSKRRTVFERIRQERGEINVLQVCTFGTEGTRSAIASAGRGYRSEAYPNGLSVEETQYLSSLIPMERGFLRSIKDCIYGNEEKGWQPIQPLINELNKFPGLLKIIQSIEGIVCRRGVHASGVILYNNSPFETNAIMRSPSGDLTTQFSLHESEFCGDVKYDYLVTEISDKITICVNLLQEANLMDKKLSLRECYNKYLHPSIINTNNPKLWEALKNGTVMDVFQFSTNVGLATAKKIQPKNPVELTSANALMRLMGEEGKERPIDRYCRLKNDIRLWYKEVADYGLTKEEIKVLEPYYLENYGVPCSQEDLMEVCLDPKIAHFSLSEANYARKIVAKKKIKEVPALKEKFVSQCPNRTLGEYVWETVMMPQMSYSFARPHSTAYSFVGIQTLYLATNFPEVFWNCACLIVNAGGADLADNNLQDDLENKSVNYGKISTAIGKMKRANINVLPPDINKSKLTFAPIMESNSIVYGVKGIEKIGTQIVCDIINNRPYISIEDFLNKVKVNKTQMVSLIKSGAFDGLYDSKSREQIMDYYIDLISDKKKRITLQNMQMLIQKNLIPEEFDFNIKLFNFNKYIKKKKKDNYYQLDSIALVFYCNHFDESLLKDTVINQGNSYALIEQSTWDNIYKKEMEVIKDWMKENQDMILDDLNLSIINENLEKYAEGNVSKWEMDSLSFYYHDHELQKLRYDLYGISDYFRLPNSPEISKTYISKDGKEISIYNLVRIAGTVIDKDKDKNTVTLLTREGVVNIKVWRSQFSVWDRQISEKDSDGNKKVLEKSWFTKGTKLIITGIKREDNFIPKKYKNTEYPLFERIDKLDDKGIILESTTERIMEE